MSRLPVLATRTTTNGVPISFSQKTLTGETFAALVTGETFTLEDARKLRVVFMIDKVGTTTLSPTGAVRVDISADTTAADVCTRILTAINASALRMTAAEAAGDTLLITQDDPGPEGNTISADTVTDATFAISDTTAVATSGGLLRGGSIDTLSISSSGRYGFTEEQLENDKVDALFYSTAGSATMEFSAALWLMDERLGWFYAGTFNDGVSIGETGTDAIYRAFPMCGLAPYRRVYYQITAIGGTATSIAGEAVAR